ncbi:MAG: hypothetical protein AAFQ07_16150 [Chloroflexota bacterium]
MTDTQGQTATANFTWTINSRPPAITIPNIDVCWIEDPNGNSTAWRITNDNPVPFTPNTQERIVFDWEVTLNGNFVQQAHNHSQTGEFRLNTPLSNQIEVVFKIWDNGIVKATQTVIATREQHPCNPPVVVTPEAPEVVVTTPEATQATDVPAVTEVVVVTEAPVVTEVVAVTEAPQATAPIVTGFMLVDASTGQDVRPLSDGDVISLAEFAQGFTIRAITEGDVGSVSIQLSDGRNIMLNTAPYTILGGTAAWHDAQNLLNNRPGEVITMTATAYEEMNQGGASHSASVSFTLAA